jgi:hypothetical protein
VCTHPGTVAGTAALAIGSGAGPAATDSSQPESSGRRTRAGETDEAVAVT